MATKASRFRYEHERSGPKRKKIVKLEASAGKPSRKAKGHVKAAAALTVQKTMEQRSPSERAQRGRMPSRGKAPTR